MKVLGVVILFWVLWVAIYRDYGSWGLWLCMVVSVAMAVAVVVVAVAMVVVADDYCDVYFILLCCLYYSIVFYAKIEYLMLGVV